MLYQISNSFIHLKDTVIKEEFDFLDEYNRAFEEDKKKKFKKVDNNIINFHENFIKFNYFKYNNKYEDMIIDINSKGKNNFDSVVKEEEMISDDNIKSFYEFNSDIYKNKSNLSSMCNIKEYSSRLIQSLSTTQKILMISAFIASELDSCKDNIILRGVKKTLNSRRIVN